MSKTEISCDNCLFRQPDMRDEGWCYFWREESEPCHHFEPVTNFPPDAPQGGSVQ